MNNLGVCIRIWLKLIGTKERAEKLLATMWRYHKWHTLSPCPTVTLFGEEWNYGDCDVRPALDAWDAGHLSPLDISRLCTYIIEGNYNGPAYNEEDLTDTKAETL